MLGKTPLKIGITAASGGVSKDRINPQALKISQATKLSDLSKEYVFYTPALIYMKIRLMGRDPVTQFVQEYGKQVTPFSLRFNKPVFHGLNLGRDVSWNYVLFGMEREHWEAFKSFMGTMAFTDRQLKLLARIRTKEIVVADPLFFEKATVLPAKLPLTDVTVFCLDTNQGCAWIEMGVNPLLDLPQLVTTDNVYPDTAAFANAVFNNAANPYAAADSAGLSEAVPRGVAPLQPQKPVPLESLPPSRQSSLQGLLDEYNKKRGKA